MMKIVESNNEYGSQLVARWMLLVCISLVTMGIMYSNDTLPAIAPFIFDAFEDLYSKEEFEYYYNTLCSLVSVPNLIFPLLAGVLIDTVSLYYLSMALISFLILGQFILTLGFGMKSLTTMLIGRCIFGLGSESSLIAFNSLLIRYFPDWEVALALSICLAIGRIGSVLSDMVSPIIATLFPVYWTFLLGLVLMVVGGVSVIANIRKYYLEDLSNENVDNMFNETKTNSHTDLISHNEIMKTSKTSYISHLKFRIVLVGRKIRGLGRLYWYLSILGLLSYSVIMPFNYIAGPLIVETQYKDIPASTARQYAGIIMSLLYAVSVLVLPILGWIVDRVGERCKLLTISVGFLALAHALMLKLHPAISITILGFGYTLFATVYWPCISLSVPPTLLGTALGVVTCIQNFGFIITPIQVAFLHSTFKSYVAVEAFFLLICIMALIVCYIVSRVDIELGGKLDSAPNSVSNTIQTTTDMVLNDLENLINGKNQNNVSKIRLEELICHKYLKYENGRNLSSRKFISSSSVSTFDDSSDDSPSESSSFTKSSTFLKNDTLPLADYSVQNLDDSMLLSTRSFSFQDDYCKNNPKNGNKFSPNNLKGIII
ncbi:transporter protein [Cryptosporidium ubiquitum]|uniref:Lysosomal dipeptide transporter MFSD1 n=1 Tax=Cryptosporidium ubiquitum TaxID=857276 RepID=A0A1J4MGX2_9CRYT|nr:transporter protein [Cryptosporidium ubiquitum]OII72707.1 transporter protein [Cryptosporidium ubiquitum]